MESNVYNMENSGAPILDASSDEPLIEEQDMMPPAPKKQKEENNAPGTATVWTPSNPIFILSASFNARYALTTQQNFHLTTRDDMLVFETRQISENQMGFRNRL